MASRRPGINDKVVRGIRALTAPLDALFTVPDDSELQTLSEDELNDAQAAFKYMLDLAHWHEAKKTNPKRRLIPRSDWWNT